MDAGQEPLVDDRQGGALQQAALGLMQKSAGKEYSYAHPMFWAPFVLVGDGG